jgi:hypothetical protein
MNRETVKCFLINTLGFLSPIRHTYMPYKTWAQLTHSRPMILTFGLRLRRPSSGSAPSLDSAGAALPWVLTVGMQSTITCRSKVSVDYHWNILWVKL